LIGLEAIGNWVRHTHQLPQLAREAGADDKARWIAFVMKASLELSDAVELARAS
jgi:hypothetical protein